MLPALSMQNSCRKKQENADNNIHTKAALFVHIDMKQEDTDTKTFTRVATTNLCHSI